MNILTEPKVIQLEHAMRLEPHEKNMFKELGVLYQEQVKPEYRTYNTILTFPVGTLSFLGDPYQKYHDDARHDIYCWERVDIYQVCLVLLCIVHGENHCITSQPRSYTRFHIPSPHCYHIKQEVRQERGIGEDVCNLDMEWWKFVLSYGL